MQLFLLQDRIIQINIKLLAEHIFRSVPFCKFLVRGEGTREEQKEKELWKLPTLRSSFALHSRPRAEGEEPSASFVPALLHRFEFLLLFTLQYPFADPPDFFDSQLECLISLLGCFGFCSRDYRIPTNVLQTGLIPRVRPEFQGLLINRFESRLRFRSGRKPCQCLLEVLKGLFKAAIDIPQFRLNPASITCSRAVFERPTHVSMQAFVAL